jgi:hypothetical protein
MHRVEDTASAEYFAPDRDAKTQRRRILEGFPSAVFLDEPGESKTFGP